MFNILLVWDNGIVCLLYLVGVVYMLNPKAFFRKIDEGVHAIIYGR